ncbi:hypothetical protein HHI36_007456 [Cryptolaemus montrouzieri]|uniref:Uncharacterized protein n=1 Tax=Cryptolaemus montrouzieri TaxID=559131 RepID=A0ABD2MQ04_9CUCU
MKIILILLTIFCACEFLESANFVALIPSPFYSHQATYRQLWRELARKGHKITLITTDLMEENENITQIDISNVYELSKKNSMVELLQGGIFNLIKKGFLQIDDYFKCILTNPGVKKLMEGDKKFDLFFVELLIPGFPLLSLEFNCPFIGVTTMDAISHVHSAVGNAVHPALYPLADLGFGTELTFKERLISTSVLMVTNLMVPSILFPIIGGIMEKYIGKDLSQHYDINKNVSLVFTNANPILFPIRPVTPVTINLGGGLHFMEPKKLPKPSSTQELAYI